MRLIISIGILAISTLPALADRQVTEDERAKLVAAVQAEGCSGGKFEFDDDDQQFEVDDAVCADGKKYDLKFDPQMKLKRKNLDREETAAIVGRHLFERLRRRLVRTANARSSTRGLRAVRSRSRRPTSSRRPRGAWRSRRRVPSGPPG
jgi:hypothetical protein